MGENAPSFPPKKQELVPDRPGGRVPESQLWMARTQNGKEVGFTDPEGQYHALGEGETFQVEKDRDSNRFDVVVVGADSKRNIYHSGPLDQTQPMKKSAPQSNLPEHQQQKVDIDKVRLNELNKAMVPGALFGKEVVLTANDAAQVNRIADAMEAYVKGIVANDNDPEWKAFEEEAEELRKSGADLVGTFPPRWLINGGTISVKRERRDFTAPPGTTTEADKDKVYNLPVIVVPDKVYNAYYWKEIAKQLRNEVEYGIRSKGSSAKYLGENLRKAAHFLKETGQL